MELNDLENSNSVSRRLKVDPGLLLLPILSCSEQVWLTLCLTWLCPTIGLTFLDIFFDSLLAIEYFHQWSNSSYVNQSQERCQLCLAEFHR